jgi:hypothetical protein
VCEKYSDKGIRRQKMQTAIESRELVVWAPHKSLAEAKSLSLRTHRNSRPCRATK